ncbi:MAG: dienelactone hydrolase family protein [Phycisphaerae bacterium]|nr:dienelactone hydrolase family protein [Phycisphaerae bacterium]
MAQFKPHTFEYARGKTMPYRLFEPKQKPGTKYPLVIFLHGAGGRGKDNKKQIHDVIVGPCVWALPANQAKHPCFVLAPQSSGAWAWSGRMVPVAKSLIDKIVRDNPVDASRIYLTGLSMGGYGTWSLLAAYPDFFAAGLPVCGKGDPSKAPALVKHKVAVWAFHGAKDRLVSADGSRDMIAAIRKAGGKPKYTEYPDVGHNSWEGAYTDPNLVEWTFAQRRDK